jgi:organic radical activating enzyme
MAQDVKSMSEDDFEWVLDFLERSGDDLRIIGGEPTLHPHFCDFLLEGVTRKNIKHVHIFSNGTFSSKVLHAIAGCSTEKQMSMLVNCNSPQDIGEAKYQTVINNVLHLAKKPIRITLGINVYKPDLDYSYLLELAKSANIKEIRWTVAIPTEKIRSSEAVLKYFAQFVPFMARFVEDCITEGLHPHADCNSIPVCMLDDNTLRLIALIAHDNLKPSICHPVIDVKPDLSVIRCFGMDQLQVNLKDFKKSSDVIDFFKREIDALYVNKPLFDSCERCATFAIKGTACTCLSFGRSGGSKSEN